MDASMTVICYFVFFLFLFNFTDAFRKDIFSTKTAYKFSADVQLSSVENQFMKAEFNGKSCSAVNFQVLLRHGARYPGYKDIRKMSQLHEMLKIIVKSPEANFIHTWKNDFPEVMEKQLVDEGEEEQFGLGERFGKNFKDLFHGSVDSVDFYSSSKERCLDSAAAFYEGLTEAVIGESFDNLKPIIDDDILRFHATCKNYFHHVENNRSHLIHHKKFKTSSEMETVARNVANRLGVEHAELDAGDLKLIYFWCTFEMIILNKDDWCHLLSDEDKEVIEYHNDIKQYWKKAYGHPVIGEMACPIVNKIFNNFKSAIDPETRDSVGAFYFGHCETLAPVYAALGLFNDSLPLTDTNFELLRNRSFKSSKILPFSANIATVLYECPDYAEDGSHSDDFVVRMFVNEKPVVIPACDEYVCRFDDVWNFYLNHIESCNIEKVCGAKIRDEL